MRGVTPDLGPEVIIMALPPPLKDRNGKKPAANAAVRRKKSKWVTWIAITLGVFMVGAGILMTLWGFAWQANLGEVEPDDNRQGGPELIPIGLVFMGLGIMWVWNGYNGFPRRSDMEEMKMCPKCHKKIEADLNFCYHCNTRLSDEDESDRRKDEKVPEKKDRKAADLDQL